MNAAANSGFTHPAHMRPGSLPRGRRAAQGQALLVLIIMLSSATMVLVYGSTTELMRITKVEQRNRAILEHARQALIGRAVADASRPGSLPCPDGDDDGSADLFVGSACPSYLGRLPWRTLGIGDLRDAQGERLWYALSPNYRDHPSAPPLNSDTKGTLSVFSNNDATSITRQGVAVIFAPGLALPGQSRDAAAQLCSTSLKTVPRAWCAANYLDPVAKLTNASAAGPYINAQPGLQYNDALAVIVVGDFMPLVEQRVALELRNALLTYRMQSACACYPWADSGADGTSDIGANRGRIPARTALPQNWSAGTLPAYFVANEWARVIHYAVAREALEDAGNRCTTCMESTLSVDGAASYDLLLITSGYAGTSRPSPNIADYIDDSANRGHDDRYVTPAARGTDRDRIYPILAGGANCAAHAQVLIQHLPCAEPGKAARDACKSAHNALSRCTCSAAANALVNAPCINELGAPACNTAITQLRRCTL